MQSLLVLLSLSTTSLLVQGAPFNVSHAADQGLGGASWWLTSCGSTLFAGSWMDIMEWEMCEAWCNDITVGANGEAFQFAHIVDSDEMECVRTWMMKEIVTPNPCHYWLGGSRDEYGRYQWTSGHPMTYTDFVENPGNDLFIHLTPPNGYSWNTKNNQNDRNNGCLCRLDRD